MYALVASLYDPSFTDVIECKSFMHALHCMHYLFVTAQSLKLAQQSEIKAAKTCSLFSLICNIVAIVAYLITIFFVILFDFIFVFIIYGAIITT